MLWWLLAILIAAVVAPTLNRIVGSWSGWVLAVVPAGVFIGLLNQWPSIVNQEDVSVSIDWVPALNRAVSLRLDGLSLLFGLMVTGIGSLVLLYAGAYLKGDERLGRLWILLLIFMAAMLGLVLADNLLTLFTFWELTSITSYLLIGFNSDQPESRTSALQALLVTGGGGLVLLPGLLLLGAAGGSFEISTLLNNAEAVRQHSSYVPMLVLILVGAFTKSAQFPFHFWLPNAMAVPTPISAYLHSATMVKAGVYLIARLHPILGGTAEWFWMIAPIGTITMVLGAVLALRATDLKQILAYATISVLGTLTMLLGIGTEATLIAALAVLVAHAFYKGGLFMMVGAVDHAITEDGLPLGSVDQVIWTRDPKSLDVPARERKAERKRACFEEKESHRWLDMMQSGEQIARSLPETQFVMVADSESDIGEVFCEASELPANYDFIVRQSRQHSIVSAVDSATGQAISAATVDAALSLAQWRGEREVSVGGRDAPTLPDDKKRARKQARISRKATLSFRAITVTIAGPRRSDPDSSCEKHFTVSEWMAVNAFLRKPLELTKPPTVRELMISIAQLGGYINKKSQGDPGSKTIWRGMARFDTIVQAFAAFNQMTCGV